MKIQTNSLSVSNEATAFYRHGGVACRPVASPKCSAEKQDYRAPVGGCRDQIGQDRPRSGHFFPVAVSLSIACFVILRS